LPLSNDYIPTTQQHRLLKIIKSVFVNQSLPTTAKPFEFGEGKGDANLFSFNLLPC